MTKEEIAPAKKLRDDFFKKFEKIDGVHYPSKDFCYDEEFSFEKDEEYGASLTIGFSFQMDSRKDVNPEDLYKEAEEELVKLMKGTEFEKFEIDTSHDHMDAYPDGYHAYKVVFYIAEEF